MIKKRYRTIFSLVLLSAFLTSIEPVSVFAQDNKKETSVGQEKSVNEDTLIEETSLIEEEEVKDTGKVNIVSSAPILSDFKDGNFEFSNEGVIGTYEIYARESIKDSANNEVFKKDELVKKVNTDKEGKATVKNLLYGKYYSKEESTGSDMIRVESGLNNFELTADQAEANIEYSHTAEQIDIKVEGETETEFGYQVIALADIVNINGEVIAKSGDVVSKEVFASEDGTCVFKKLPTSLYGSEPMYEVMMSSTPDNYILSEETFQVKGDINETVVFDATKKSVYIYVNSKDEGLNDVSYTITDSENNIVNEGTIDSLEAVSSLGIGNQYTINLTKAGYIDSSETFSITEDKERQEITINMETTKVNVSLTDSVDGSVIKGSKYSIKNGKGEEVQTFTSDEKNVIEALPQGEYLLVQNYATKGYIKHANIPFVVEGATTEVKGKNERVKGYIEVGLVTSVNRTPIEGGQFTLLSGGDTIDTVITSSDGKAKTKEFEIAYYENGAMTNPISYTIVQTNTADGYQMDNSHYDISLDYLDDTTPVVYKSFVMPNKVIAGETPETKTVAKRISEGSNAGGTGITTSKASSVQTGDFFKRAETISLLVFTIIALALTLMYSARKKKNNI